MRDRPVARAVLRAAADVVAKVPVRLTADPSFFLIGAQKCGTTSLYTYLCEHPRVVPARRLRYRWQSMWTARLDDVGFMQSPLSPGPALLSTRRRRR